MDQVKFKIESISNDFQQKFADMELFDSMVVKGLLIRKVPGGMIVQQGTLSNYIPNESGTLKQLTDTQNELIKLQRLVTIHIETCEQGIAVVNELKPNRPNFIKRFFTKISNTWKSNS